ncbi:Tol-Pal system beta propeller repeat protein TolB [Pleionea sp. CnH1-48]|uniref:Tol-Pal system beta propeller repeat protein TolB n=1 Tax=Pleionea sp. CnH1-48 TaxID=2954494 RepID=UPI002097CD41|nr:Tol-Pal system beta propeller repeat protein TolB [Pleionea sp. CnH1-48]MCO7224777.1 Tol-Pal system beta propeller repeat protein TolB [Pleionea sp. CnH1-48]
MIKRKLKCWLAVLLVAVTSTSRAEIEIVITDWLNDARPIAVVPFAWQGTSAQPPFDMSAIIAADLRRSGRFDPMAFNEMPQTPTHHSDVDLDMWKKKGIEAVVVGKVQETSVGQYTVSYALIDVFKSKQVLEGGELITNNDYLMLNRVGRTTRPSFRFYTHQVADNIYQALTGERGAFATRIAYVTVDRSVKKSFQLFIADSDGYDPKRLFSSEEAIMSPTWAPDGRSLAYVSFENGRSEIYHQKIYTGERNLIAAFPGINSAPVFSPDGNKLALTLSKDGNPEIYILDLQTRRYKRMTNSPYSIETEPEWSPDGQSLLFTSDRGGRPQLYRVPITGGRPERVTFSGEYNASGNFTPDGKSLILVNRTNGVYHIAKQDIASGDMQILTDTHLDESPSLAPNGSMVIYATIHRGRQVLAAVSADGRFKIKLPATRGEVRAPAWSPYLVQ